MCRRASDAAILKDEIADVKKWRDALAVVEVVRYAEVEEGDSLCVVVRRAT